MTNMLAGNKRSRARPIEQTELLERAGEMPTHQRYGAVRKQLTGMGRDEEPVRALAAEKSKGQEWYNRVPVAAPAAMECDVRIVGASRGQSIRIPIGGRSFNRIFGTRTAPYQDKHPGHCAIQRESWAITPFPITTAA